MGRHRGDSALPGSRLRRFRRPEAATASAADPPGRAVSRGGASTRRQLLSAGFATVAALAVQSLGGGELPSRTTRRSSPTPRMFSTADYAQVGGDDRPRVASAVAEAVAAIAASGLDQTVLIHQPLTFTTGVTKAALGQETSDPFDGAHPKQGVPIPVNLAKKLHIVFAPGAKITLSADCQNAFYIDKLADYDVFQNVEFHDAWVDGADVATSGHALIGNTPNGAKLAYLSFRDISFLGVTRFTNFYWDAGGAGEGQVGIGFYGQHNAALEVRQTFSNNIYLQDGRMEGGGGLFCVTSIASARHRPGGCNHYYDNIIVGTYRYTTPSAPTSYTNHEHTGVFICGAGFGDYGYIGPGYVENIGDDAIEVGAMQRMDIVEPRSKNPYYLGILLRQTHAPIDVDSQRITIRAPNCEVTSEITAIPGAWGYPIRLMVDDQVISLTSGASGGSVTFTVPGVGTTGPVAHDASASTIAAAFVAIGCTGTVASGGPLGTSTVTVNIGNLNLTAPVTFTSSLSDGSLTLELAPSNASFGTVTIEDAVFTIDGLTYSKHRRSTGLFVHGLDQPHRTVEVLRPKVVISNYNYDSPNSDDLSLYYAAAPYEGWGNLVLRDHDLTLGGTCDFQTLAGQGNLYEVNAGGQGTRIDIDGMTNDRAAARSGKLYQVVVGLIPGSAVRARMRRLSPRTLAAGQTNGGARLFDNATVAQFDVFDSDLSQGTSASEAIDLSNSGGNAAAFRSGHNIYPPGVASAAINPTESPFTWQNSYGTAALVQISSGIVSQIESSPPHGSFATLELTSGPWTVEPGALLRVTYSAAPTMSYTLVN